jgi:hypothetical protein
LAEIPDGSTGWIHSNHCSCIRTLYFLYPPDSAITHRFGDFNHPSALTMTSLKSLLPLLAVLPAHVDAWGSLGHTTVAYIAQNFISGKTTKFAQRLLNDTSGAYLANVATWADSYRSTKEGAFSGALHYIDALDNPPESCNLDYARDCPEEGCIISAIANYSSRAVDKNVSVVEQQKALKWIIHFVGDVHQPLHVEFVLPHSNVQDRSLTSP